MDLSEIGGIKTRPEIGYIRYTHDALVDMIIARPEVSQGELARTFGFTENWMSIIIRSDAFKARLEERKAQVVDPMLIASTNDRLKAVTERSLEVLMEHLDRPARMVDPEIAIKAAQLGLKSLPGADKSVNVNIDLRGLAQNMLQMRPPQQEPNRNLPEIQHVA